MKFDNFHLNKSDYSINSLETLFLDGVDENTQKESDNVMSYIQNASYHLDGLGWSSHSKPLSDYARKHLLYLQSFTYFELKNYYTKREGFDSYQLKYTYEGEGILQYEGKCYMLRPGEGFLIDCRKPHMYRTKRAPWKHCEIHFSGAPAVYIYEQLSANSIVHFEQPIDVFHLELEKLLLLNESILPSRELQISHQIEHILLTLLCHSDNYRQTVQNIPENLHYLITYLDQNYMQSWTLDYMADFSNISKYHLCRLFQKHLHFSPNEYLIQLRIENAKKLLLNTTFPASKIAAMVGIPDENYFYRIFKSRVGLSAGDFRKSKTVNLTL